MAKATSTGGIPVVAAMAPHRQRPMVGVVTSVHTRESEEAATLVAEEVEDGAKLALCTEEVPCSTKTGRRRAWAAAT
jgi:hypothetical protein